MSITTEETGIAKYWFYDRQFHREDDLPAIEYNDGTRQWFNHGKIHRLIKPAVDNPNGYKAWYKNGKLHRLNAHAIIFTDGRKEYWEFGRLVVKPTSVDLDVYKDAFAQVQHDKDFKIFTYDGVSITKKV